MRGRAETGSEGGMNRPADKVTLSAASVLRVGEYETARLARKYALDCVNLVARAIQMDHVSTLLFLATVSSNIAHITHDPGLAEQLDDRTPTDDDRRPVSLYALARAYHLSYETARRHMKKLMEAGLVVRTADQGLIVPTPVLDNPTVVQVVLQHHELTRTFLLALRGEAADSTAPVLTPRLQAARLTTEYFLTFLRISAETISRDLVTTLVCLAITQNLTEQHPVMGGTQENPSTTVLGAAKMLNLPYETTRRHAHKLIRLGFCERAETGKIRLAANLKAREATRAYLATTIAETVRLAERLRPVDLSAVAA